MRAVFISYRRDDTECQAGRLYDDLVRRFGGGAVFMDVAGIEPGLDFRQAIDQNVASCSVLLAVMGPGWIDAKDEMGRRRLDNPMDFVRLETASALKRDIAVIPVLVHGAKMPRADLLPADLKELAYRNGLELTHARWDSDLEVLIRALQRYVGGQEVNSVDSKRESQPHAMPPGRSEAHPSQTTNAPSKPSKSLRAMFGLGVAGAIIAALLVGVLRRHPPSPIDLQPVIRKFEVKPAEVKRETQ